MRDGSHTISQLQIHIVWVTKYRYPVLKGDIQKRCRDMITQICDTEDIRILIGVVSKDHVHMHIEYSPSLSVSDIVKKLKDRSSRKLQMELVVQTILGKTFLGNRLWSVEYRECKPGYGGRIPCTPQKPIK